MIEITVSLAIIWSLVIASFIVFRSYGNKKHSSDFIFEMDKKIFALAEEVKREAIASTERADYLTKKLKELIEKTKETAKVVEEAKTIITATTIAKGFSPTKRTGFGN